MGVGTVELELLEEAPMSVAVGDGEVLLSGETAQVDVLGDRGLR